MGDYDHRVFRAKDDVTKTLMGLVSDDPQKRSFHIDRMAGAIDELNKAWDELTDCLVRQRTERDAQILKLIDQLAEAKKR